MSVFTLNGTIRWTCSAFSFKVEFPRHSTPIEDATIGQPQQPVCTYLLHEEGQDLWYVVNKLEGPNAQLLLETPDKDHARATYMLASGLTL